MHSTLVILAAGASSRFGKPKQLEPLTKTQESLMLYSIYDAYQAGFNKFVFIVRESLKEDIRKQVLNFFPSLENKISFVYQNTLTKHNGETIGEQRKKPWGTAEAVIQLEKEVDENFAIINADDFYGKTAFQKAHEIMQQEKKPKELHLLVYLLAKTLSPHGPVSRGVCEIKGGKLQAIHERKKIQRQEQGIGFTDPDTGEEKFLQEKTPVSMNFWILHNSIFTPLKQAWNDFLQSNSTSETNEFLLPEVIGEYIQNDTYEVKTHSINEKWLGLTYYTDKEDATKALEDKIINGEYPSPLTIPTY